MSEVLEQWLALQRQWMYLEPIFSSPDIMQQLPLEGKRFAAVDRNWRKTLEAAKRTPNVIKVGTGDLHGCWLHQLHFKHVAGCTATKAG